MSSVQGIKKDIRLLASRFRKQLSEPVWGDISRRIQDQFIESGLAKKGMNVGCYVSSTHKSEVNTAQIISHLHEIGAHVALPRITNVEGVMEMVLVDENAEMKQNSWGISEPVGSGVVASGWFDMIIVPMLAGDFNGNRLGFGKGYYDRYLLNITAIKVGLCNADNMFDTLPANEFDQILDQVITEYGKMRKFTRK
jgi:5-formyltetrahydrofolate cyclo-ligase